MDLHTPNIQLIDPKSLIPGYLLNILSMKYFCEVFTKSVFMTDLKDDDNRDGDHSNQNVDLNSNEHNEEPENIPDGYLKNVNISSTKTGDAQYITESNEHHPEPDYQENGQDRGWDNSGIGNDKMKGRMFTKSMFDQRPEIYIGLSGNVQEIENETDVNNHKFEDRSEGNNEEHGDITDGDYQKSDNKTQLNRKDPDDDHEPDENDRAIVGQSEDWNKGSAGKEAMNEQHDLMEGNDGTSSNIKEMENRMFTASMLIRPFEYELNETDEGAASATDRNYQYADDKNKPDGHELKQNSKKSQEHDGNENDEKPESVFDKNYQNNDHGEDDEGNNANLGNIPNHEQPNLPESNDGNFNKFEKMEGRMFTAPMFDGIRGNIFLVN